MLTWATATVPTGWLEDNGAAISTNVTAGANVWVNTGEGVGGIDPFVQTSCLVIAGGGGGADGGAGGGAGGYRPS